MENKREGFDILQRGQLERVPETKDHQEEGEHLKQIVTQEVLRKPENGARDIELERTKQMELRPRIYIFFDRDKTGISFSDMSDGSPSVNDANEDKYVTELEDISMATWDDKVNAQKGETGCVRRTVECEEGVYEAITYIVTEEEFETIVRKILLSDDPRKIEISVPRAKYNDYDDFLKIKDDVLNLINTGTGYNFDSDKGKNPEVAVREPNFNQTNHETISIKDLNSIEDITDSFSQYNQFDSTGDIGFDNHDSHKGIK